MGFHPHEVLSNRPSLRYVSSSSNLPLHPFGHMLLNLFSMWYCVFVLFLHHRYLHLLTGPDENCRPMQTNNARSLHIHMNQVSSIVAKIWGKPSTSICKRVWHFHEEEQYQNLVLCTWKTSSTNEQVKLSSNPHPSTQFDYFLYAKVYEISFVYKKLDVCYESLHFSTSINIPSKTTE